MTTPWHQNPSPRGHEIYNFGRPFLSYHDDSVYIFNMSDPCPVADKTRRRTPAPGVMKFTILEDPSLFIITIYLVCLFYAWEKRRIF